MMPPEGTAMDEWLSTRQAAALLGVSTATIYRMEKRGLVVSARTPGGQRRFRRTDLETYRDMSAGIRAPQNPSIHRRTGPGSTPPLVSEQLYFPLYGKPTTHQAAALRPHGTALARSARHDLGDSYGERAGDIRQWLEEWEFRGSHTKTYTHGFHAYPAMFIPQVARKLLLAFTHEGDTIADIFCGSGTALVEARLLGRHAVGVELNPLAVLIARAKTTPIEVETLHAALRQVSDTCRRSPLVPVAFSPSSNLAFWFPPAISAKINSIKQAILGLSDDGLICFFYVALSEVIRRASLTKHAEFKLVRDKNKVENGVRLDVYGAFMEAAMASVAAMGDFVRDASNATTTVIHGDSTTDVGIADESLNMVLTSPPYGDSRTTVAYGQFSRLPAQWFGLLPDDAKDIDRTLLGGDADAPIDDPVGGRSDTLRRSVALIAEQDVRRARDVVTFYRDLYRALERAVRYLKGGGYFAVVIGNRTVKGITLRTDLIISELCDPLGMTTHALLFRAIPNKRMPLENSPTNIPGMKAKTMHRESIVVMRKRP
jgi:excisionase family DNA binding protein